jgi:hypothetical protein
VKDSPHGCEDNLLEWRLERECLHVSTKRICYEGSRQQCMETHQVFIWPKASTSCMVRKMCEKTTKHLLKINFKHFNLDDATLFVKKVGNTVVYILVYVDDFLIIWNNETCIASIKRKLKRGFEMTEMGHLHYYLGIEVTHNLRFIFISSKYIRELLNKFGMIDCSSLFTPMEKNLKLTSK